MTAIDDALASHSPLLLDGAMGTMLQDSGLTDGGSSELWNVEHGAAVADIHRGYLSAGARVITTNTFGGTSSRLGMHSLEDRVEELNHAAAALARSVADEFGALVAGDIGPTGDLFEPLGALTQDEAQAIFELQLRGLSAGGIDLVLIETISDLAEATAAVRAAQAVVPDVPILVTMSFDTKLRTMMGVSPSLAVTELGALGVAAVGANCGRGPEEMEAIMADMVAARPAGLLLIAQSNAGLPHVVGDHFEYDKSPADMAAHAVRLRDMGVELIGSCCGSTPAHTKAMAAALLS